MTQRRRPSFTAGLGYRCDMLTLAGRYTQLPSVGEFQAPLIVRLSEQRALPRPLRKKHGFIIRNSQEQIPEGFGCYVAVGTDAGPLQRAGLSVPAISLPASYSYLADGDIVRIDPRKKAIRVVYRRNSLHNSFLLTERCNHYCLMCSQPPKDIDDSWIVDDASEVIGLIPRDTFEIGFTGGEPTLYGD